MRNLFANLCLLLVSCVVGLCLCEVSLRLFYPKYRHVAESQFHSDAMRIWANIPNFRYLRTHPDILVPHSLYYNNLALRQHRNFNEADLASAINIGVFGDSFVENVFMAAPYSFTEPLDYLLNQRRQSFNVLNFGVGGYGPGQSFLHYEHFRYAEDLDHVFFVYCQNDLWDLRTRGLFHLDDAGQLVQNEGIRGTWWAPLLRRFHTPYLILDVSGRWSSFHRRRLGRDRQNSPAIFRQLIRRWKDLAEDHGSTFSVVLLPTQPEPVISDLLTAEGVEVIDLYACFGDMDPAHPQRPWSQSPYRFKNDSHWNEAGNRWAAVCLSRVLEEKRGLPKWSEEDLWEALFDYYAAFGDEIPLKVAREGKGVGRTVSPETTAAIREKYLAIDMFNPLKNPEDEFIKFWTQSAEPIIASDVDVYFDRNQLIYIKEDCNPTDTQAPIFLHVIPADERDLPNLPKDARQRGFSRDEFNLSLSRPPGNGGRGCLFRMMFHYPIRYIRTGQYVPDAGRRWEGEAWIAPHGSGAERPALPAVAGERLIRADFDVYLNGRQLVYHKAQCGPADREPPFFLQVTPTDASVLPPDRRPAGVARLDFGACTTERELPAYAIRHIRTGQYTAEGRLWEVEFPLDPAGGGERGGGSLRRVRSVFDVTLDGRRLRYHKAACRRADRAAPFFVHVTPVEATALPPKRLPYGFENLDFQHPGAFSINEFGCTIARRLPAYAIRRIRTGQYIPGEGRLWEGAFAMREKIRKRKRCSAMKRQ